MSKKIYVWDPLVRLFHWLLVAAFITSYLTGEEETPIHIYSGYLICGLISFRLLWGFIGSKHARFSDFVRPIPDAIRYLKNLFSDHDSKEEYIGHNPAGGLMVIALLVSLSMTCLSGLKLYGTEGHGPLADTGTQLQVSMTAQAYADDDEEDHEYGNHEEDEEAEEFWEEIHEFFVNFTLLLVILHIAGVALSSRKHATPLVKAMITGYKDK